MHAVMDLDNEKIQMRKEIKRAKVWVMSKLVRQIRNLKSKKGNEVMKTKNIRRAQRLEEELNFLKELKPDEVFKQLINFSIVSEQNAIPQMTLKERALNRIGSVSFIKTRVNDINLNVCTFHQLRSGKDTSDANLKMGGADCQNNVKEPNSSNDAEHPTKLNNCGEVTDSKCVNNDVVSSVRDGVCFPDFGEDEIPFRNVKAGTGLHEFTVAAHLKDRVDDKPGFQEISLGYDDITHILTNVGDGFHSDNTSDGGDIELQDVIKPSRKGDSSSKVQDAFFLNCAEIVKNSCDSEGKMAESHSSDDELSQVKSCFVESLASVCHRRNGGKNRPSQRARRRLATNDVNSAGDGRKLMSGRIPLSKTDVRQNKYSKSKESVPLHPSWEASRKRKKEQNHWQEFRGKRVCFDDSD